MQLVVHCPQQSMAYNEHWCEVPIEYLIGEDWFDVEIADLEMDRDNLSSRDLDFLHWSASEAVEFAIEEFEEGTVPDGWTITSWEEHVHKDANGLVTFYFEGGNCDFCGSVDIH